MKHVSAVVAASRNGVIGRDGGLPWHLSSDLKLFKSITMGNPIIMGRRTWDSLPRKPLPGRVNIVVSRNKAFAAEDATVISSLDDAIDAALAMPGEEVCIIGGGQIYADAMDRTTRIYLTRVHLDVEGDTWLPALDEEQWREVSRTEHARGERDDASFTLIVLERVAP